MARLLRSAGQQTALSRSNLVSLRRLVGMAAPRSFIVTAQGTLERMPAPIVADNSTKKRTEDMKIVFPKTVSDSFAMKLRSTPKYMQNNTANSLNIRDYVEAARTGKKERQPPRQAGDRVSFHLRMQL